MNDWRQNPYNVRHYIRQQHRQTRSEFQEIQLLILGLSEQLREFQAAQIEAFEQQRKIYTAAQVMARILAVCVIVVIQWLLIRFIYI